jgi:D-sedoheptulose 7-phosphate isomerase/D-glycero-D-manno-heptose 1,7-bisphosphate phosphatase
VTTTFLSTETQSRTVPFPAVSYRDAASYASTYMDELARAAATIDPASLDQAAEILLDAYTRGRLVFSCGNGGSAAVANHLQCDHLKGVRNGTDLRSRVVSLSSNVELLTAIANDVGYHESFSYQLRAQSEPGDVLVAISSSGRSANILHALQWARDNGLRTIALTGFDGGGAREMAEAAVHVDSANYGIVEDLHQSVMHALAQYIRQTRMSPEAIASSTF